MNVPQPVKTDSSSSVPKDNDIFASQDGLLELLVAIRGSSMPSEYKMEARDAVLEYSQQTDTESRSKIKQDIISILSPYQKDFVRLFGKAGESGESVEKKQIQEPKTHKQATPTKGGFRGVRPAPVFRSPQVSDATIDKRPTPPTQIPARPAASAPTQSVPSPEQKKPEPPKQAPVTETPPTQPISLGDHTERIKAIKRSVNERVGNPINLIDTNNEVGREYMNALLDAMKRVSGDGAGADAAMRRLEAAYQSVEELLAGGTVVEGNKNKEPARSVPVSAAVPVLETTSSQTVKPKVEPVKTEAPKAVTPPSADKPTLEKPLTKEPDTSSDRIPLREIKLSANGRPVAPVSERFSTAPVEAPVRSPIKEHNEPVSSKPAPVEDTPIPQPPKVSPEPVTAQVQDPAPDRAEGLQLRSLADIPAVSARPKDSEGSKKGHDPKGFWSHLTKGDKKERSEPQTTTAAVKPAAPLDATPASPVDNRLFNPKVDAGLAQLLSEWKLFRSSGIFGTGPNGKDHPLYKSLAQLAMASVIAGRFEGATPEVKQSITDYMNGWRYEQGIVHELNETFEHYLRRVIAHILERSPKKDDK